MSDFVDIFGEVLRIVTFQPREARMRYRLPEWEERMQAPDRERASWERSRTRDPSSHGPTANNEDTRLAYSARRAVPSSVPSEVTSPVSDVRRFPAESGRVILAGIVDFGAGSASRDGACHMKKVAVFGNAGGGKSTLAKRLADLTRLPLYPLDMIQYRAGGGEVPYEEYLKAHADLLRQDEWIIDGFGCVASAWERFSKADTLVYIDLPLITHHWWVTKRLIKGLFVTPEGWPENSPMWRSTMSSYRVLWLCHREMTPRYRQLVADVAASKRVHHVKSPAEMTAFLNAIKREYVSA